jgi:hypothetical protein
MLLQTVACRPFVLDRLTPAHAGDVAARQTNAGPAGEIADRHTLPGDERTVDSVTNPAS